MYCTIQSKKKKNLKVNVDKFIIWNAEDIMVILFRFPRGRALDCYLHVICYIHGATMNEWMNEGRQRMRDNKK